MLITSIIRNFVYILPYVIIAIQIMELSSLPTDPAMLMSYLNTKLRDEYKSLDALCDDLHINKQALEEKMSQAGFEYSSEHNRFW